MKSLTVGAALASLALGCASESPSETTGDAATADAATAAADVAPGIGDGGAASDAAVKAPPDQGAIEDAPPPSTADLPRCGPGPYQLVKLGARNLMAPANQRELAGARISLAHCPGVEVLTGADGKAQINVTAGAATWIRFDAKGFVPWLCGEMKIAHALGTQGLTASMLSESIVPSVLTSYGRDRPLIYVQVQAGRATAAEGCRARDGVTITVKNHPEAVVLYRQVGSMAPYLPGPATTAEGAALVTGLLSPVGAVEVLATKNGCTYVGAYGDANSAELVPIMSAPLQDGAITYQVFNPMR
jgi:hypothetical protein